MARLIARHLPLIGRKIRFRELDGFAYGGANTDRYWEQRYSSGGNSGAGSYGRLAKFKADFVNSFVREHNIKSVLDFGCGDGAQAELFDFPNYTGIDVSETALARARERLGNRPGWRFVHDSEAQVVHADLTLSLDTVYNLVDPDLFGVYMTRLLWAAERYIIIYSSNHDERPAPHVQHRRFTDFVEQKMLWSPPIQRVPNPYPWDPRDPKNTSPSDFYVYEADPERKGTRRGS